MYQSVSRDYALPGKLFFSFCLYFNFSLSFLQKTIKFQKFIDRKKVEKCESVVSGNSNNGKEETKEIVRDT